MTEETLNNTEESEIETPLSPEEQALQDKINKLRGIDTNDLISGKKKKRKKKPTDPDDPDDDDDDDDDDPEGTSDIDDDDEEGESDENEKEDESKDLKKQREALDQLKPRTTMPKKTLFKPKDKNMPKGMFQQMFDMLVLGKDGVAIRDGKISPGPRIWDQILLGLGMTSIKHDIELQQQAAEYLRQKRSGITPNPNLLRLDLTPKERATLLKDSPLFKNKEPKKPEQQPEQPKDKPNRTVQQEEVARVVTPTPEKSTRVADTTTAAIPVPEKQVTETTPQAQTKTVQDKSDTKTDDFNKKNNEYYQQTVREMTLRERAADMLRAWGMLDANGLIPRISNHSDDRITFTDKPSRTHETNYDRPRAPDIDPSKHINNMADQRDASARNAADNANRSTHPGEQVLPPKGNPHHPKPPRGAPGPKGPNAPRTEIPADDRPRPTGQPQDGQPNKPGSTLNDSGSQVPEGPNMQQGQPRPQPSHGHSSGG